MSTKSLHLLFALFCLLLPALPASAAQLYRHDFNNKNFNAPTVINANMTAAWTSTGGSLYSRSDGSDPGMAIFGYNHVYILTITMKERYQAEITSISMRRFSGDNATMQIRIDNVNYGTSFTATNDLTGITRTKTVSELRNRIRVTVVVTNSNTPNNYSHIDDFIINGTVTSYDPAAEATPDGNGILYVDGTIPTPGDGSSWDNALKRVHYATRAAAMKPAIKQVWVADGTYETEAANTPLALTDGVAYYGGFNGYESELRERSLPGNATILKGLGGNVLSGAGAGTSTRLDGFTISDGTGLLVSGGRSGGGLYLNNSSPVIANCTFTNNHTQPTAANGKGGAIYLLNSSPLIIQSIFTGNSAKGTGSGTGGAIYLDNASPVIRNCTFTANEVGGGATPDNGGALYIAGSSSPVIENNIVWNNTDPASPGSVSSISGSGTPTVAYSLVQGGYAGGSHILDADPQFTDVGAFDFRQLKGSPVTNAGNPATDLAVFLKNEEDTPIDLNGDRRLTSSAIDLGPFEVTPSAIWYVNATSTTPDPSGDSWPNAFATVSEALEVASAGDQVWVARGEYTGEGGSLRMIHGVNLYGSFAGTETSLVQRTLPIAHGDPATASVLSGCVIANINNDATHDDVFDGFTVAGAPFNSGIRNINASPTVSNCAFLQNSASDGGGMYNENASPLVINTRFSGNSASFGNGGAIANKSSSVAILINCVIDHNTAGEFAGAIYNDQSTVVLLNCTVTGNTQNFQGTINGYSGDIIVRNSIIYGNGGGISSSDANITATYSLVEGMAASETDHNLDGATDPQFNSDTDLTLRPCSPAVNRGSNETSSEIPPITTDLLNNPRIYNVQTDMGAYELQAIPGPGTLPASGETVTLPVYAGATALAGACKFFGMIEPTGEPGTLGNVTVKSFMAAGNTVSEGEKVFVKRHYDITPSGTDGPAKVTLFYSKQDFDDYNQAFGNAHNATLPANLKVVQYHGTSPYGFPGTYSGNTELITNVTVTESADHTMYLVSFNVSGFSGFFISGQSEAALPVTLVSFNATKNEDKALLQWQTSSEINSRDFEIERSNNGKQWMAIGQLNAHGSLSGTTDYSYTDLTPMAGTNLYRLKMIDLDGTFAYSRIISLDFAPETAALYPNPAVGVSKVELKGIPAENISTLHIYDLSGRELYQTTKWKGAVDVGKLVSGQYVVEVRMTDGVRQHLKLAIVK